MTITGPYLHHYRALEEEYIVKQLEQELDSNLESLGARLIGVLERCTGCRRTRKPGVDPLWPLVPILYKRSMRVYLDGYCPKCAARLLAFMLVRGVPWLERYVEVRFVLGIMKETP